MCGHGLDNGEGLGCVVRRLALGYLTLAAAVAAAAAAASIWIILIYTYSIFQFELNYAVHVWKCNWQTHSYSELL